ncbi:MAG: OmpW family protein [Pelomonas sp.]|nr:OmpW family protein [Roseateles sp.]
MKPLRTLGLITLALAGLAAQPARADDTPWLVRVRAVHLSSANSDSTGLGLTINNKTFPEVDFSYFFAPNFSAELILTYPQSQTLYSDGSAIGSLKHLPPTLLAQYQFIPGGTVHPYVGVGINYTNFSSVSFAPAVVTALHPSIKNNSFGAAAQIGVDIDIAKGVVLNFDLKKVEIGTTVYSSGVSAGKFKVDPTLLAVGVGWRF